MGRDAPEVTATQPMLLAAQVCYVVRGVGLALSVEEILDRWSVLGWWPGHLPTLDEVRAGVAVAVLEGRLHWVQSYGEPRVSAKRDV